jgi:hypothetical protein
MQLRPTPASQGLESGAFFPMNHAMLTIVCGDAAAAGCDSFRAELNV